MISEEDGEESSNEEDDGIRQAAAHINEELNSLEKGDLLIQIKQKS